MLGLSKSAIGSYEAEISEPSFDNLIKISELFNVNIDYLLGHSRESISWNTDRDWFSVYVKDKRNASVVRVTR